MEVKTPRLLRAADCATGNASVLLPDGSSLHKRDNLSRTLSFFIRLRIEEPQPAGLIHSSLHHRVGLWGDLRVRLDLWSRAAGSSIAWHASKDFVGIQTS